MLLHSIQFPLAGDELFVNHPPRQPVLLPTTPQVPDEPEIDHSHEQNVGYPPFATRESFPTTAVVLVVP